MKLRNILEHPLTRGLDIDDPQTTALRRDIIRQKGFLNKVYEIWYEEITENFVPGKGPILELGTGGGFLKEVVPGLITSEIFYLPGVDVVLNGQALSLAENTISGIVLVNVMHHLTDVRKFFFEATRCVCPGGTIIFVEPWITPWSRFVYQMFHSEPCQPNAIAWEFPPSGYLSGANQALPWIIFQRDRSQFENEFPQLSIQTIKPFMPFLYLLSGGISKRSLMPERSFNFWRKLEHTLGRWYKHMAMFAVIVLRNVDEIDPFPS